MSSIYSTMMLSACPFCTCGGEDADLAGLFRKEFHNLLDSVPVDRLRDVEFGVVRPSIHDPLATRILIGWRLPDG